MNSETKEGSQGVCSPGWRIPTDADWKKLEGYFHMSVAQQEKNNTYRGKNQANLLHQGRFNAKLLGFFGVNNRLLDENDAAHFVSSTQSADFTEFYTGRKIAIVPTPSVRFILIKQTTVDKMAIGDIKVISEGDNVALNKTTLAYEAGVDNDKIAESNIPRLSEIDDIEANRYTANNQGSSDSKTHIILSTDSESPEFLELFKLSTPGAYWFIRSKNS
jgi:hypothetical protein